MHPLLKYRWYGMVTLAIVLSGGTAELPLTAGEPPLKPNAGAEVYRRHCVGCHGEDGNGMPEQDVAPFAGKRSLDDLTQTIAETMPEDDPDAVTGAEARQVAEYLLHRFFDSADEQEQRPNQEFARLTVHQYRQSVADLGTEVFGESPPAESGGLSAQYYNDRRPRRDKRVIERIDPVVDFDFGEGSPSEKIGAEQFSVQWSGSLIAPDTGEYQMIVESNNGFKLWLNDPQTPLIDAWVRSGDDAHHQASIFLVGGRRYPLRIEYFKFKDKTASIHLKWRRPHYAEQVIPPQYLSPQDARPVLVASVPFPPDDRSYGYERGNQISSGWQRAVTQSAVEVADQIVAAMPFFLRGKENNRQAVTSWAEQFVARAFRRPLDKDLRAAHVIRIVEEAPDTQAAVRRVVLAALLSPRFLFRETPADGWDDFDVASRLAFVLWDSLPDKNLLAQAARGQLHTPQQIEDAAERMLDDRRTRAKIRLFYFYWLRLDLFDDIGKDTKQFVGFDEQLVNDLRTSLQLFLDRVTWEEDGSDFRQLLLSDHWYANQRLAKWYGGSAESDYQFLWQPVPRPDAAGGVLTHPLMLSGLAYHQTSSPIHRGVFIARGILGRRLKVPPVAVAPLPADANPEWTTRERIEFQTKPTACRTCHDLINPLGFPLETFDAVGKYRETERGKPIDASGWVTHSTGERTEFNGPRELAVFLAHSPETHRAFANQMFHELVKQPILAFGLEKPEVLTDHFEQQKLNIRRLIVDIAVVASDPANQMLK